MRGVAKKKTVGWTADVVHVHEEVAYDSSESIYDNAEVTRSEAGRDASTDPQKNLQENQAEIAEKDAAAKTNTPSQSVDIEESRLREEEQQRQQEQHEQMQRYVQQQQLAQQHRDDRNMSAGPQSSASTDVRPLSLNQNSKQAIVQSPVIGDKANAQAQPVQQRPARTSSESQSAPRRSLSVSSSIDSSSLKSADSPVSKKGKSDDSERKKRSVFGKIFGKKDRAEKTNSTMLQSPTRQSDEFSRSSQDQGEGPYNVESPSKPGKTQPLSFGLQQRDMQQQARFQQQLQQQPQGMSPSAINAMAAGAMSGVSHRLMADHNKSQRPGSLLVADGSTALSVLRVFAGDGIKSEATFKTILLSKQSTSEDIVAQAVQRLQIHSPGDFFLSIKQIDGRETELSAKQTPLTIIESLGGGVQPASSAGRTSVGSLSSLLAGQSSDKVANDFGDDSLIKLYINRRTDKSNFTQPLQLNLDASKPFMDSSLLASSPIAQFPMHITLWASELAPGLAFNAHDRAVVQRNPQSPVTNQIESVVKILWFARNTTVAEVVEASLDRFGIEGVVAGGDAVDVRLSSAPKAEYRLAVIVAGQGLCQR